MKQLLFSCMHRTSECPSFISSCQFTKRSKRWIVSTSDSKEDGCTVIAVVFTRSHPEPGSQAHLRQFRYCGARAHGNVCHCAPLPSLGRSPQSPSDESAVFRKERNAAFSNFFQNKFRRNHEPKSVVRGERYADYDK